MRTGNASSGAEVLISAGEDQKGFPFHDETSLARVCVPVSLVDPIPSVKEVWRCSLPRFYFLSPPGCLVLLFPLTPTCSDSQPPLGALGPISPHWFNPSSFCLQFPLNIPQRFFLLPFMLGPGHSLSSIY